MDVFSEQDHQLQSPSGYGVGLMSRFGFRAQVRLLPGALSTFFKKHGCEVVTSSMTHLVHFSNKKIKILFLTH